MLVTPVQMGPLHDPVTWYKVTKASDQVQCTIAHCRNMRALGRVCYIDEIENLNISTEILMNEKLPDQV